jgi:hypothetical protein
VSGACIPARATNLIDAVKSAVISAVLLAAVSCSHDPAAWEEPLRWHGDSVVAHFGRTAYLAADDAASDSGWIAHPLSVRSDGQALFISDPSNDRIAVADTNLIIRRWIGSRGRGPGELYGLAHLDLRRDRIVAGDAHNGRIVEFDRAGRYVGSYQSPFAAGSLTSGDTTILVASRSATHYAALVRDTQPPLPALPRPDRSGRRKKLNTLAGHDLLVADAGGAWVFDQASAALCRFDAIDARPRCRLLPASLVQRMRDYTADRVSRLEAAIHMHVEAAPLAKDMIRLGDAIALLLPLPELPVAIIHLNDGTVTPVISFPDTLPSWARTARTFTALGGRLVLAGDDGIGILTLRHPSAE